MGKHYGVHLGPVEVPTHEGIQRYNDHGENFYYPQEDALFDLAAKRTWDWNVIRPNAIVGFTPAGLFSPVSISRSSGKETGVGVLGREMSTSVPSTDFINRERHV